MSKVERLDVPKPNDISEIGGVYFLFIEDC